MNPRKFRQDSCDGSAAPYSPYGIDGYLRANIEARAISDRYRRHQAASRKDKESRLHEQVGELIRQRLDAGYEGISAREVWLQLDDDLKSVQLTYRQVATAIAAND